MPYVHDEIARRAFELYSFRREHGLPGDSGSDWLDAERGMTTIHFERALRELERQPEQGRGVAGSQSRRRPRPHPSPQEGGVMGKVCFHSPIWLA